MSKGSKQRPTDKSKYDEGWDRIFVKSKLQKEIDSIQSMKDSRTEGEKQSQAFLKNEYYDKE